MPKGQNAPFVNFGKFNHSNAAPDATHDAFVWDLKRKFLHALWRLTKFLIRKWYWTFPASILWNLLRAPGDIGVLFMFLLVTTGCMYYRFKLRKPKVVVVLTEDEQAIKDYTEKWSYVARKAGLAQAPTAEGMGAYKAYVQLATTNNAAKQFKDAAYGAEDDSIVPELLSVETAPLGYTHTVRLLPGTTVETFSRQAEVLAALWMVATVRIAAGKPGFVQVTPIVKDPMAGIGPFTLENYKDFDATVHSVQIGLLEDGTPWNFPLGVHSIVAGNSGGGKSVCYRALITQMATVPEAALVLVDLKRGIEAKPFRPRLSATAKDMDTALEVLRDVWAIAEYRLDFLEERGFTDMKDYGFSKEMPRLVVLIDECSELFAVGEPDRELAKQGKEAIALVSKMLRLVRAAGITIIMATQRPSTEVVPSGIRELTQNRAAFRMMNSSGAIMALGELPDNSISPVDITENQKGRAVVTDDQGHFSFGQCRFIDPETAKAIAEETSHLTIPLSALLPKPEVQEEDDNYVYEGTIDEY